MVELTHLPKVSVCVITYNQEQFIGECLQSIVDQKTNFDFEIIVGDDCSSDRTREVIQEFQHKFPEKIRPVFQQQNIGRGCNNYRVVHRLARGTYIAHMDGDDKMEPGKLQRQSDFLDQHPECSMVVHGMYKLHLDGSITQHVEKYRNATSDILDLLKKRCYFANSSKMYRSSIRDRSEVLEQPAFIDFELHIECARYGRIGYIGMPLMTYRETESSVTRSSNERVFELVQYSLRGYDLAIKYGVVKEIVLSHKCAYIYESAIFFVRRGSIEFANKCFDIFDEIRINSRPAFYAICLLGNFKRLRMLMCKAIVFIWFGLNWK